MAVKRPKQLIGTLGIAAIALTACGHTTATELEQEQGQSSVSEQPQEETVAHNDYGIEPSIIDGPTAAEVQGVDENNCPLAETAPAFFEEQGVQWASFPYGEALEPRVYDHVSIGVRSWMEDEPLSSEWHDSVDRVDIYIAEGTNEECQELVTGLSVEDGRLIDVNGIEVYNYITRLPDEYDPGVFTRGEEVQIFVHSKSPDTPVFRTRLFSSNSLNEVDWELEDGLAWEVRN